MSISYSDSEVRVYHPICEKALNCALESLRLQQNYRVVHHQHTGTLEMDFVLQNTRTGKYLCVVEVKRTPADVSSARYQYQAMSYVQMNDTENEKPFYVLTNLEYAFSFRYDPSRPRVVQQMLSPGLSRITSFSECTDEQLEQLLTDYFIERISEFKENRYEYLVTLDEFSNHMQSIKNQHKMWKSHLAVLLYEYIRGALFVVERTDLRNIRLFNNNVEAICNEAARVNFKDIFNYSNDNYIDTVEVNDEELLNLFDFGKRNVSGDSVAGILHQIVSSGHEHDGEVPTDLELARIVALLAKHVSGEIRQTDRVCDPAAGSGNLISSAIGIYNLSPTQILANDYNSQLLELLSLRLGLSFARTVSQENSPRISNENISNINADYFNNVKVILMNPPFVAGINCTERKAPLIRRLESLSDTVITHVGQMSLEGVFLELVTELVEEDTTIACVFPKTHLTASGIEAQAIRRLLVGKFGLRIVFNYPGEDIFENVIKDTCVLVGKAKTISDKIKVISSYTSIPNIDNHRLSEALNSELSNDFTDISPDVAACCISNEILVSNIENGWRFLNSEMVDAVSFVKNYIELSPLFCKINDLDLPVKRGKVGNNGGSDLLFFNSREDLYAHFIDTVSLKHGLRNADLNKIDASSGDLLFLDINDNRSLINDIIEIYKGLEKRDGQQQRHSKTTQQWMQLLEKESHNYTSANTVLVPRAIRKSGKAYFTKHDLYVSTNFVMCPMSTYRDALLMASWMTTVFYQLICEVFSKDQEGMRKMEVKDIKSTFVPKLANISQNTYERIVEIKDSITFLDLNNPVIRELDMIWATELFGDRAQELLYDARRLLQFLANKRNR